VICLFYSFMYLAFINFLDGAVTYFGLKSDAIEEANPIMRHLYEVDPFLFLGVKIGLSILLLLFYTMLKTPKTNLVRNLAFVSSIIYTLVCFKHYYWISLIVTM
jgi:hypothetical protein